MRNQARARGDLKRLAELNSYSPSDRAKAFDVAAELLAHHRRLLGSWPAAVVGYNAGHSYVKGWLDLDPKAKDPVELRHKIAIGKGKVVERDKWQEMVDYVANVFRGGVPVNPHTADMYEPGNVRTGFSVAAPIRRSSSTPDFWRIPKDTRENP